MKPALFTVATVLPLLAGLIPTAHAVECATGVVRASCFGPDRALLARSREPVIAGPNKVRTKSSLRAATIATGARNAAPRSVVAADDPAIFVSDLGAGALAATRDGDTAAARQGRFRQLYRQNFDVEACARFALGPHWQNATAQQRQEFVRLYEDYVVIGYSTHLHHLGGQSFTVLGSQPDKEGAIVTSRMNRIDGALPIGVDWQLNRTNHGYKVTNVTVSGISMASMQRADLVSVIQRNSGHVPAMLVALRDKNASNGIFQ
jgi:phospholipid transport system substrate-binding protein